MDHAVLTINGGSSSLKFALFRAGARVVSGNFERIGAGEATLTVREAGGTAKPQAVRAANHEACVAILLDALRARGLDRAVAAVGHRIVHGGSRLTTPQVASVEAMAELRRLMPLDPEHLPAEIALVEACRSAFGRAAAVLCFDTAFHAELPVVARMLAIPRKYYEAGVRRYGFHGLSYTYLMRELGRAAGERAARGRVILAHLGNGASMAAVREGRCIDTTMAFTPTAGLVMGTRSGDLDPGVAGYLGRTEGMSAEQFAEMASGRSGLVGISETSSDVRDLLERESRDPRAAEALVVFCYQARKWIGALAAALGGVETLVFAGGIGENSAAIRARCCEGLACLGLTIDAGRNERGDAVISPAGSAATVRVIRTDEEAVIAEAVTSFVGRGGDA